jgi:hypothetical protein
MTNELISVRWEQTRDNDNGQFKTNEGNDNERNSAMAPSYRQTVIIITGHFTFTDGQTIQQWGSSDTLEGAKIDAEMQAVRRACA